MTHTWTLRILYTSWTPSDIIMALVSQVGEFLEMTLEKRRAIVPRGQIVMFTAQLKALRRVDLAGKGAHLKPPC